MLINTVIFLTCLCGIGFLVVAYFFVIFVKETYQAEQQQVIKEPQITKWKLREAIKSALMNTLPEDIRVPLMLDTFEECVDSLYLVGKYQPSNLKHTFRIHEFGQSPQDYPEAIKLTMATFDALQDANKNQDIENQIIEHIKT
ncbi:MAG: hypothetical protein ACKVTZ_05070, partial [Bacteroidia bacterium]